MPPPLTKHFIKKRANVLQFIPHPFCEISCYATGRKITMATLKTQQYFNTSEKNVIGFHELEIFKNGLICVAKCLDSII